ncbi:hypothetical protein H4Q26_017493 [Puccinia striiformis f. sp. tritici PST-130]|uniref:DUF202 domain-containing protein n=1 Tax=Puccinia striiformis TaxID=27350 RepID=A0A2S4W8N2_9BASI|nr:hypothetical protein Pst134EB_014259 [Puccinia striiformis f. sp. tritici]KAI9627175.1 hypothetical protein H4Q26_017493 [Puccinia striiformis f. sp. tritici PST-130]POW18047.1 hypothetical protein PSTT_00128 [Puccinia striiformis]
MSSSISDPVPADQEIETNQHINHATNQTATSQLKNRSHLYRGHRRTSLIVEDLDELTEWRARQRTFDGAYLRTALGSSFFALTITKMFSKEFSKSGLEFGMFTILIIGITYVRRRRLNQDFLDVNFPGGRPNGPDINAEETGASRIWGRDYRAPGDLVILMTLGLAAIQINLIVVISNMD